jgi:hypothetical protein
MKHVVAVLIELILLCIEPNDGLILGLFNDAFSAAYVNGKSNDRLGFLLKEPDVTQENFLVFSWRD